MMMKKSGKLFILLVYSMQSPYTPTRSDSFLPRYKVSLPRIIRNNPFYKAVVCVDEWK